MVGLPGDIALRGGIFLGVLVALLVLEACVRGHNPRPMRGRRWPAHVGLILLDTVLARFLLPAGLVGVAAWAQVQGSGLLNQFAWPAWLEFGIALVLLDLAIYWQHRLLHAWPLLWRLHRVHHTDHTLDATSALRFHPLEILFSLAYKIAPSSAAGHHPVGSDGVRSPVVELRPDHPRQSRVAAMAGPAGARAAGNAEHASHPSFNPCR